MAYNYSGGKSSYGYKKIGNKPSAPKKQEFSKKRSLTGKSQTSSSQGGRSNRAFSTSGYSMISNLDLRNDEDFKKHTFDRYSRENFESSQNRLDREHDFDSELLHKGLVRDRVSPAVNLDIPLEMKSPLAALGNLFSKITDGAGQAIASVSNLFSNKIAADADERKHYGSLALANKMDKRRHRSAAFSALSRKHDNAVAYRRSERAKKKAHRREKDRIAFQRGYW